MSFFLAPMMEFNIQLIMMLNYITTNDYSGVGIGSACCCRFGLVNETV